jgi:uncharacterized membrane protein YkoI
LSQIKTFPRHIGLGAHVSVKGLPMSPRSFRFLIVTAFVGLAGCEHSGVFEPFREVSCFEAARVSLKDAIAAAEGGDARAIDADYRLDEEMGCLTGDPGVYDITLLAGSRIITVSVDARTRTVGPREESGVMNALFGGSPFEGSPVDMARMVPRLGIDISQAIDTAEKDGGKAMVAWIEAKNGRAGYTVKLVERGRIRETWIDGERGT